MRKKIVALTKLRAVGLSQPQEAERAGLWKQAKIREEGGAPESVPRSAEGQ